MTLPKERKRNDSVIILPSILNSDNNADEGAEFAHVEKAPRHKFSLGPDFFPHKRFIFPSKLGVVGHACHSSITQAIQNRNPSDQNIFLDCMQSWRSGQSGYLGKLY